MNESHAALDWTSCRVGRWSAMRMVVMNLRMLRIFLFLFFGALVSAPGVVDAQSTFYVRQGATGANNGSDWNNAYTTLPSLLVRGATYYVAAGDYGNRTFSDVESGTATISIKKATVADHGTHTGWNDAFAQPATFGAVVFARDYYVFDGAYRDESRWDKAGSYGFRVSAVYSWPVNYPPGGDHITIRYCDIGGAYSEQYAAGLNTGVYIVGNQNNITVSRCYIHNVKVGLLYNGVDTFTVEYCYIGPGWGKEGFRGNGICRNGIIRYNIFRDSSQTDPNDSTSGTTADIGIWASSDSAAYTNIAVYGNVIWNTISSIYHTDAAILIGGNGSQWVGAAAQACVAYNNTLVGLKGQSRIQINGGSGNRAFNNLWHDSQYAGTGGTGLTTGNNLIVTNNPFVAYAVGSTTGNFRLTAGSQPINAGSSQGSPYNVDMDGNTRGADGAWDVGAFEYTSGGPVGPTILTQPQSATVTVGNSATFTVTAGGTAPLSYQWQRDGVDLPEADANSYTHPSATLSDNGATFRVIVSNSAGSTTSQVATLTVTSTPNQSPTVSLTAPANNATYTAPAAMTLTASAADSDGSVAKVEFFSGGTKLGEDTTSPYSYAWSGVGAGSYSLTARATDNLGATTTSAAVNVTVTNTTSTSFSVGDRVMVDVDPSLRVRDAADLDGTVLGTQAYQALGTVTAGPVSADGYTWWQIDYDADPDGWSIEGDGTNTWLIRATEAPPPPPTGLIVQ